MVMKRLLLILLIFIVACNDNSTRPGVSPENAKNTTEAIGEKTAQKDIKITPRTEFRELVDVCYYRPHLRRGQTFSFNLGDEKQEISLVGYREKDQDFSYILTDTTGEQKWQIDSWAEIMVDSQETVKVPLRQLYKVRAGDREFSFVPYLIRDNYVDICIVTDEKFDISFCEKEAGEDRTLCFDNIGVLYGIEECESLESDDKNACERGALNTAG